MSDTSMLHACAARIDATVKPGAKAAADWLWAYADRHDTEPLDTDPEDDL